MIELGKWVGIGLVKAVACAETVNSLVDSISERLRIGLVLSGDIVARPHVRGGAYQRQPTEVVDVAVGIEGFERCDTLVVIHG